MPIFKPQKMRSLAIFAVSFVCCTSAIAGVESTKNIAYDDNFVWYAAGRLAGDLVEFQTKSGIPLTVVEQRPQYEILYHNFLLECDGPLPQIAAQLKHYDYSTIGGKNIAEPLMYVGKMNYEIWPIIREWNARVLTRLLDVFVSGKYEFFPTCIVGGFLEQNKEMGLRSQ